MRQLSKTSEDLVFANEGDWLGQVYGGLLKLITRAFKIIATAPS